MTAHPAGRAPDRERERIYRDLAERDGALAGLIARHGHPDPFSWSVLDEAVGGDPFAELALHIVSQQISTPAALTIYGRLRTLLGGAVDPSALVATPVERLRSVGLSGAKARSLRDLAEHVCNGTLSFDALAGNDDATAQAVLTAVRGIGPWSAQMFLLHYYRRPDIFPEADIGLLRSAQSAFALPARPTPADLHTRAESWRPFRSYAAALLWAHGQTLPKR
jgi:DNA-3-methyladenine glycosylase II